MHATPNLRAHTCNVCGHAPLAVRIDFGPQPISSRFLATADEPQEFFPMLLAQCEACGVLQMAEHPTAAALKPRFDWITYREAEAHLDRMVQDILAVSGAGREARIVAASYKDASTIDRFRRLGYGGALQLDPRAHLEVDADRAEIETVQDRLTADRAARIAASLGRADVALMRHVIEHTHSIHAFAAAIRALVKPGGVAVFEVPDFEPSLRHFDYSTLWEEHVYCFTPTTLPATCARLGFEVLRTINYAYPIENALVVMVRVGSAKPDPSHLTAADLAQNLQLGAAYAEAHPVRCKRLQQYLSDFRRRVGPVAVFGAGHLTCKYINLMGIGGLVDFVADADPNKLGKFMPGSALPILHPSELEARGVKLCLLGLSAESEARIRAAFNSFTDRGGQFASISPISPTRLHF
jgi:hypothetical protein